MSGGEESQRRARLLTFKDKESKEEYFVYPYPSTNMEYEAIRRTL